MRPEDLMFWLDSLRSGPAEHGVLCRRHADTMVVPRGWTLDDLRDPDLHLFRPPADDSGSIRPPRSRRSTQPDGHEQLALGVDVIESADLVTSSTTAPSDGNGDAAPSLPVAVDDSTDDDVDESVEPWMPVFDTSDDLDGLLAARSPLLSRAFRGERSD